MLIPMNLLFITFSTSFGSIVIGLLILGAIVFALAIYSTLSISETHNKDLDFQEAV